jgi:hypothetical protein
LNFGEEERTLFVIDAVGKALVFPHALQRSS